MAFKGFGRKTLPRYKIPVRWSSLSEIKMEFIPNLTKELILDGYETEFGIRAIKDYRVKFANRKTRHIMDWDDVKYNNIQRMAYKELRDSRLRAAGWTVSRLKVVI